MSLIDDMYELDKWTDEGTSPQYVGYFSSGIKGGWAIKKTTTSADPRTVLWAKGNVGYATAWTNRASLTYNTFDQVFQ